MEKMLKNAVKMEVLAALQPLEERIDRKEKASKEIDKQFSIMMKEVEDLMLTVSKYPTLSVQAMAAVGERFGMEGMESREDLTLRERAMDKKERVMQNNLRNTRDMCAADRKVVGFSPIEPRMLKLQMECYGAKDVGEAMLMEIKSYLKSEMKVPPSEIEKLDIIRIFPPARDDWNVLYVEFGSDHEVDNIFSYTRRIVNNENKLTHWIPKQMYARFRAVEGLAYSIRQEEKLKTRVKIGIKDFLLSTRVQS